MNDRQSVLGLATVRRNRGITLQQISESTKIGMRLLEAIEFGDFRKLPGGIYATSYIRQYARAIDYPRTTSWNATAATWPANRAPLVLPAAKKCTPDSAPPPLRPAPSLWTDAFPAFTRKP